MAGGSGERFWPLSRKNHPKQLLKLLDPEKTLLDEAIDRIARVIAPEDIFIITGEHLLAPIRNAIKNVPPENIIAEPAKRNTAPCLALGAAVLLAKYGLPADEIAMAVLTADQLISPDDKFEETVRGILSFVGSNPALATIGIVPSRPETGYGYIEAARGFSKSSTLEIEPAKAFHEKPSLEKAKSYIDSGNYLWNSGMFFWRLDAFIDRMAEHAPAIGSKIREMAAGYDRVVNQPLDTANPAISSIFEAFPDISIDYSLMEKAENVVVARALFDWDDVGSWDALDRVKARDGNGNVCEGNAVTIDSSGNIIINNDGGKVVGLIGVDGLAVITTDDAVLVCPKDRVQEIKKITGEIKNKFDNKWL